MVDELSRKDLLQLQVDVWKKIVEVQQHFNDIEMRIRALCLTVLSTLLAASGYESKQAHTYSAFGHAVPTQTYLLSVGIVIVALFWFMDAQWYHRLLRGAVAQGTKLEQNFQGPLGLHLTQTITEQSHFRLLWLNITSGDRLNLFYGMLAYVCFTFLWASVSTSPGGWKLLIYACVVGILILILSNHAYNHGQNKKHSSIKST